MTPEETWYSLSREDKYAIARTIAQKRGKMWAATYKNVISVGVGLKSISDRRFPDSPVCLKFLVSRKWVNTKNRAGKIPEALLCKVQWADGFITVAIPTDVEVMGDGEPGGGLGLAQGVIAAAKDGNPATDTNTVRGVPCCLVRRAGTSQPLFLLGCHHVFTRSLLTMHKVDDALQAMTNTALFKDKQSTMPMAEYGGHTPMACNPTRSKYSLDVAWATVVDERQVTSVFCDKIQPTKILQANDTLPATFKLHTPRGMYSGVMDGHQYFVTLLYGAHRLCFRHLLRFYLNAGGSNASSRPMTQNGDSGSPLIAQDGTLLGMHFYRMSNGMSFAIPASELFSEKVSKQPLELVVDHNL